jgi:hypothetical protein
MAIERWASRAGRIIRLCIGLGIGLAAPPAHASSCDGPIECCTAQLAHGATRHEVALGIVLIGLSNLNERSGTWDADFYLYEEWTPATGFTPQTELANEVARQSVQFDTTSRNADGRCLRSRRIRSTLRTAYNLRRFPFDHQQLAFEVSDDEFTSAELVYASQPYTVGVDDAARATLSSWKLEGEPAFRHEVRAFHWERGAPVYDNATVQFTVRRHVTFHLFKYFLPLLVIVVLAFTVFWIDAEDLGAPATIGVTCLLAAIAFQFAEASSLPEVSYLTLADRVYIVCYLAIAAALIETVCSNRLARGGDKDRAARLDRRCRLAFPLAIALALIVSVIRAFTEVQ